MTSASATISALDGRQLGVETSGNPSARAILFHSGTSTGRVLYPKLVEETRRQGLFLIGYDRPGYGRSTARLGRTVADCADDVFSIAQHFNIDRMATWGFSGGGPHSLATAVLLPDLISASLAFCPLMPRNIPDFNYFGGMSEEKEEERKLFLSDPTAFRAMLLKDREEVLASTDKEMRAECELIPSDQAVPYAFVEFSYQAMRSALEPGISGSWDDFNAFYSPWGFELKTNQVPVGLWHGKMDKSVPFYHSEWLALNVPNSEIHLTQTDGHLSVLENNYIEGLEWLLQFS